jgi:ribose transport system substrate-binding protein
MSSPRLGRRGRAGSALVAGLAAMALLAACGSTAVAAKPSGASASDSQVAAAQKQVAEWSNPLADSSYPTPPTLSKTPDVKGKTVYLVPLSDGIPVIHSIVLGVEQALTKVGANFKVCDGGAGGQPNPTSWGNCLKTAADQNAGAVMTFFIDYEAVATQFDALAKKGIPTLIAGVQEKGLTPKTGLIDFYDNTPRLDSGYSDLAVSALAHGGAATNILWLRLLDSTATTGASDAGIAKFKAICPSCGITTADFTTPNSQAQLAATVSAALVKNPDTNLVMVPVDNFTPLVIQGIQQANKNGKVQIISGSGSLDAMQRIKAGTQLATQASPIQYEGWLFANGLMQLLAGERVQKNSTALVRDFSKDNVDSLTLTPAAAASDEWFGTGQPYMSSFLKAWGLS